MQVMIIDDEWFGIDLVEKILLGLDEDIEITGKYQDPTEALPYILAKPPQLIILDAEMRFINGLDLTRMLLHTGAYFIIITAHDIRELARIHPLERTRFLSKPFSIREFNNLYLAIKKEMVLNNQQE